MKVGDYVITKDRLHIGKIYNINDFREQSMMYAIDFPKQDDFIFMGEDDFKSSPNIIDLIDVGDYVNGYQVIEKPYIYHDVQFVSVDTQDSWNWGKGEMPIDEIKSIVTKEQFESMEYRIKEK